MNIDQVIRSLAFIGSVETGREGILCKGGGEEGGGEGQAGGRGEIGKQSDDLQVEGSSLNEVPISTPMRCFQGRKSKLKENYRNDFELEMLEICLLVN